MFLFSLPSSFIKINVDPKAIQSLHYGKEVTEQGIYMIQIILASCCEGKVWPEAMNSKVL